MYTKSEYSSNVLQCIKHFLIFFLTANYYELFENISFRPFAFCRTIRCYARSPTTNMKDVCSPQKSFLQWENLGRKNQYSFPNWYSLTREMECRERKDENMKKYLSEFSSYSGCYRLVQWAVLIFWRNFLLYFPPVQQYLSLRVQFH